MALTNLEGWSSQIPGQTTLKIPVGDRPYVPGAELPLADFAAANGTVALGDP